MSGGNWAEYSIKPDGTPYKGIFKSPKGVEVYIEKSSLIVEVNDVIINVSDARFRVKDVCVAAKQVLSPRESIYYVVWWWNHDSHVMLGLGTYGYIGDGWYGVTDDQKEELTKFYEYVKQTNYFPGRLP